MKLGPTIKKKIPWKARQFTCVKCKKPAKHRHHITYDPPVIAPLCISCHGNITSVNTQVSRVNSFTALSNELRCFLWKWFLHTNYFVAHRRVPAGFAKKLLEIFNKPRLTPLR